MAHQRKDQSFLLKGILSSNEIERVYISSGISSSLYFALLSNKSIVEILPLELEEKMRDPKKIRVLPKCSGNLQKLFVPQCINRIPEDSLLPDTKGVNIQPVRKACSI